MALPTPPATPRSSQGTSSPIPVFRTFVASVQLDCCLDLEFISLHARNAKYNLKRFKAVVLRIREPKTTALIFTSGRMVVTGAKSEEDSELASRKIVRIIQKLGFNAKFTSFEIKNIVGSYDTNFSVGLENLATRHHNFCSYTPELFPGLIYRMINPKIVLLIFSNGKIISTGSNNRKETYEAFEKICLVLQDFKITYSS